MGVRQGAVLGPRLWNILYNDVLLLELIRNAVTIAYTDDQALVVSPENHKGLIQNQTPVLHQLANGPCSEKETEMVIIKKMRRRKHASFQPEGAEVKDLYYIWESQLIKRRNLQNTWEQSPRERRSSPG